MESSVRFSRQDATTLIKKTLEVSKIASITQGGCTLITPSREWLEAPNPNYARAREAYRRKELYGEPIPEDLDPWARHISKQ